MAKKTSNATNTRTRNYATVVYPESAPDNWQNILAEQMVPSFISPLHDKDFNPDGEPKKAHFHVMIMFDGPKTREQAEEIFNLIGGVGCEIVKSLRGYARYLCHLDNPDKYQYDAADVKTICGADYIGVIGLAIDKFKAVHEMMDFCEKYNVDSFYLLANYAREHRSDWSRVLMESATLVMREWLKSRRWSKENNSMHIMDPDTGEILL